jgi:hypothetical protein
VSERTLPGTPAEALAEARAHALSALAEAVAALRALVDAASLAAGREGAPARRLAPLAEALASLSAWLSPAGERDADALLRALAEGLDAEIARWEARSREEPEARAVLRAFLAVREVLWELGTRFASPRGTPGAPEEPETAPPERPPRRRRARRRVTRVAVEG